MKKGFTVIEVIVAVSVIAMLILVISGLTSMSIKMNLQTSRLDESFNIASSICEIYKSNTDTYSSIENEVKIYKYINSLSDIQSINNLILNKTGDYTETNLDGIINGNTGFKYTLILKIKKISSAEGMEALWIQVIKNDGKQIKISMNAAK